MDSRAKNEQEQYDEGIDRNRIQRFSVIAVRTLSMRLIVKFTN